MKVVSLFMDECLDQDIAWLTGIFVPAEQYADVRDGVVRITQAVIQSLKPGYPPPLELHGSSLLRGVPDATDEHRLRVFEDVVALVNRERLQVICCGHRDPRKTQEELARLLMDPGDKLYTLNFQAIVDALELPADALVLPVFDGVPGQTSTNQGRSKGAPADRVAHQAFLFGGRVTHWNRIFAELGPSPLRYKTNLRNLGEPTFADSAESPLLQLVDVVGYLLHVIDRVEHYPASEFKLNVARVARKLDESLVHRRVIRINF